MEINQNTVTLEGFGVRKQHEVARMVCRQCMRCFIVDSVNSTQEQQQAALRYGGMCEKAVAVAPFVSFEGVNE